MDESNEIKKFKIDFNKKIDIDKIFEEVISDIDINQFLEKLPKSSTISKQQALRNINEAYQKEKLVLVLGAGVSIEFGVPSWNGLLQNLMVHTIEKEHKVSSVLSQLFNEIFTPNPLIAGRYLQDYFEKNNSSFESMVRDVMYSKINKDKQSNLLEEIVRVCVAPGKSPNLDSIITYNFDDILEYKLEKTGMDIPFRPIYGIGMEIKNDELPIFHVHGYLPEKKKLNNSNKITFGENNYHQQYSDIYSWNNIVQINKFRENTCLFIGSSLTDPNIRRLLDIALKQKGNKRKHHYIFKKRIDMPFLKEKLAKTLNSRTILNNKNNAGLNFDETLELLKDIYERFEENDSASFGVQTIWVEDWEELPKILKKMRENVA
ncbi:SIR2 family protein [Draconibacterium sediminis]|mgnify:CR=1 FL=1|uniref:SIR2 family protein n=1 Tax=Draconibacterium sediminis TaxID=1544798 RepID=UPI0026EBF9E6|nr:SIR2 family protein [Draconibacterium sediminis]